MTQREEVRFIVYTKTSIDVIGSNNIFPLELSDFWKEMEHMIQPLKNTTSKTQGLIYWVYLLINEETLIMEWLI